MRLNNEAFWLGVKEGAILGLITGGIIALFVLPFIWVLQ